MDNHYWTCWTGTTSRTDGDPFSETNEGKRMKGNHREMQTPQVTLGEFWLAGGRLKLIMGNKDSLGKKWHRQMEPQKPKIKQERSPNSASYVTKGKLDTDR